MRHPTLHHPLRWLGALLMALLLAACPQSAADDTAPPPPEPNSPTIEEAPRAAAPPDEPNSPDEAAPEAKETQAEEDPPKEEEPPQDDTAEQTAARAQPKLEWLDWVVSHCLIDELGPSDYAVKWMQWIRKERRTFDDFMPADAPRPNLRPAPLPAPGSPEARAKAQRLREEWLARPASHVLECTTRVPHRDCPGCRPVHMKRGSSRAKYGAYIPKALLTRPEEVKSLLLLAPGGNGGRTRYFLTPIPNKHVTLHKRSGGLEVKRHADEFYAAHPDLSESIIVSTDNGGWSKANGHIEYLSRDLPKHVADTFLGGRDHRELALSVEGISRGSRALITALRKKPEAFHAIGLTCLHCGSIGGPMGGYEPDRDLADPEERERWLSTLADRARRGLFHIRFAVGNADVQWTCNKRLHSHLVAGGVLEDRPPEFSNCRRDDPKDPKWCDTVWDGFHLYDRMPHHYALLKPSWVPQLQWHLRTLHDVVQTLERDADAR